LRLNVFVEATHIHVTSISSQACVELSSCPAYHRATCRMFCYRPNYNFWLSNYRRIES